MGTRHVQWFAASIDGETYEDHTVPADYKYLVSSLVVANDAAVTAVNYKIQLNPGAGGPVWWTEEVGGGTTVNYEPWTLLLPNDVLRVENAGGAGGPVLYITVSVIRYDLG